MRGPIIKDQPVRGVRNYLKGDKSGVRKHDKNKR